MLFCFGVCAPCHYRGSLSCSILRQIFLREKAVRLQVSFVSAFLEMDTEMLAMQQRFEMMEKNLFAFSALLP